MAENSADALGQGGKVDRCGDAVRDIPDLEMLEGDEVAEPECAGHRPQRAAVPKSKHVTRTAENATQRRKSPTAGGRCRPRNCHVAELVPDKWHREIVKRRHHDATGLAR